MAEPAMDDAERAEVAREFKRVVNMTPAVLRKWLDSEDSRSVGMTAGGDKATVGGPAESVGHGMGRRILELHGKAAAKLDADDYAAMRKVVGYVHRHGKQRPDGDISDTRWRKSLMNWGHDPMK